MAEKITASKVEVLPGTIKTHGGPHVFHDGVCSCGRAEHGHADEVELMTPETWKEAKKTLPPGTTIWSRFDDGPDA